MSIVLALEHLGGVDGSCIFEFAVWKILDIAIDFFWTQAYELSSHACYQDSESGWKSCVA
jgi:hypothetical protein